MWQPCCEVFYYLIWTMFWFNVWGAVKNVRLHKAQKSYLNPSWLPPFAPLHNLLLCWPNVLVEDRYCKSSWVSSYDSRNQTILINGRACSPQGQGWWIRSQDQQHIIHNAALLFWHQRAWSDVCPCFYTFQIRTVKTFCNICSNTIIIIDVTANVLYMHWQKCLMRVVCVVGLCS